MHLASRSKYDAEGKRNVFLDYGKSLLNSNWQAEVDISTFPIRFAHKDYQFKAKKFERSDACKWYNGCRLSNRHEQFHQYCKGLTDVYIGFHQNLIMSLLHPTRSNSSKRSNATMAKTWDHKSNFTTKEQRGCHRKRKKVTCNLRLDSLSYDVGWDADSHCSEDWTIVAIESCCVNIFSTNVRPSARSSSW